MLNAFVRTVDKLKIPQQKLLICSGIGCSSWIPSPFFKADTLHTTHGRALAFATGAKLANSELQIVIFTGDGDCASIGGNHLIHSARRNLDIIVLCINNHIYGMTGGQLAPTTQLNIITTTSPYGNKEPPFDLVKLVLGAGGFYVARWTTYHIREFMKSLEKAFSLKGFRFIEIISQCPTHYGKRNNMKNAIEMMIYFKTYYGKNKEGVYKLGEWYKLT